MATLCRHLLNLFQLFTLPVGVATVVVQARPVHWSPLFTRPGSLRLTAGRWPNLFKAIVVVWAFIAGLEVVAIGYGQLRSASDNGSDRGLARCGKMPCFRGLIPGLSPWSEAQMAFAAQLNGRVSEKRIIASGLGSSIVIDRAANGRAVGIIAIVVPADPQLVVGDIVRLYGNPCAVSLYDYPNTTYVSLLYPTLAFDIQTSDGYLTLNAPIQRITFHDPTYHSSLLGCREEVGLGRPFFNRPWRGFTSLKQYRRGLEVSRSGTFILWRGMIMETQSGPG